MSKEKKIDEGAGKGGARRSGSNLKLYHIGYDNIDWKKKKGKKSEKA